MNGQEQEQERQEKPQELSGLPPEPITPSELRKLIEESGGKIFTLEFLKADGSFRRMTARREVRKGVQGVGLSYDPGAAGAVVVYDMAQGGHRTVKLAAVQRLRLDGKDYIRDSSRADNPTKPPRARRGPFPPARMGGAE